MSATAPTKRRPAKKRGPTPPKVQPADVDDDPMLQLELRDEDGKPIEVSGDGIFVFESSAGPIKVASAARTRMERPFLTMRIAATADDEGNISTDLVVKLVTEAVKIGGDEHSLGRLEELGPAEFGKFAFEWNRYSGVKAGK